LSTQQVEGIRKGAMVHDIGKLFLAPSLLNKKGDLTEEEKEHLKQHTLLAEKLLDDPYFSLGQKIAVYHHERFDGRGYPRGLKGDEIPIEAQIVSAADVYDALRDARSYKVSFSPQQALTRMRYGDERLRAGGFNPAILATLEENWEAVEQLWNRADPARELPAFYPERQPWSLFESVPEEIDRERP
jgi:HD-GYP domain-containing protein (c-di-GMP phosphodiesterase class II)